MTDALVGRAAEAAAVAPSNAGPVLVIKLGALGDFVLALGAIQAIRRAHPGRHLVLLTRRTYRELAEASGCFDEVLVEPGFLLKRPLQALTLVRRLRAARFARVYDLQWNARSGRLFRLLRRPGLEWVGVAPGCSHCYAGRRDDKHITLRQAEMLSLAGIREVPPPDLSGLRSRRGVAELPDGCALVVPGSARHRLEKRWPLASYIALCRALATRGLPLVVVCGPDEPELEQAIREACPDALFPHGELAGIAEMARRARVAVGNDTGPIQMIAAAGCPTVALFGPASNRIKLSPLGRTEVLEAPSLDALGVDEVLAAVERALAGGSGPRP